MKLGILSETIFGAPSPPRYVLNTMKFDSIIFDLDGTLWDATNVTAHGWNSALVHLKLGQFKVSAEQVKEVCGLPNSECIERIFKNVPDVNLVELEKNLDMEEEAAFKKCLGKLYPGVEDGITKLKQSLPLFLVSNCQTWYLKRFWQQSGLEQYFEGQDCNGNENNPKHIMIKNLIQKHNLSYPMYIGDTGGDKTSCDKVGVTFGYAAYGFGDLVNEKIKFNSFSEICNYFKNMT
jgi:phosphoglycolate phosphatase